MKQNILCPQCGYPNILLKPNPDFDNDKIQWTCNKCSHVYKEHKISTLIDAVASQKQKMKGFDVYKVRKDVCKSSGRINYAVELQSKRTGKIRWLRIDKQDYDGLVS